MDQAFTFHFCILQVIKTGRWEGLGTRLHVGHIISKGGGLNVYWPICGTGWIKLFNKGHSPNLKLVSLVAEEQTSDALFFPKSVESTNSRVLHFSVFSMCCLLFLAVWQIFYLRRFFQAKKLIE